MSSVNVYNNNSQNTNDVNVEHKENIVDVAEMELTSILSKVLNEETLNDVHGNDVHHNEEPGAMYGDPHVTQNGNDDGDSDDSNEFENIIEF